MSLTPLTETEREWWSTQRNMNFSITPEIFAEWCRPSPHGYTGFNGKAANIICTAAYFDGIYGVIHKDNTGKTIGYATSCSLAIGGQKSSLPPYLPNWTPWDTGFRESVDGWYFHPIMQDGDFSLDDLAHGASIIEDLQKG